MLLALVLLVAPGAIVAGCSGLGWPAAVAAGRALTYGTVATAIVPSDALGVPWSARTAALAVSLFVGAAAGLRALTRRRAEPDDEQPRRPVGLPCW